MDMPIVIVIQRCFGLFEGNQQSTYMNANRKSSWCKCDALGAMDVFVFEYV